MKTEVIIGLVILAGINVAAHGQGSSSTAVGPAHPRSTLPDPSAIAGGSVSVCAPVHPGTAILDSMGIYAGAPSAEATVADNGCQVRHLPQPGD